MSPQNIMQNTAPRFHKWIMMRISTSDFPLAWERGERKRRGGSCERLTDVLTNCSRVLLFVVGLDGELCWVIRAACEEERLPTTSAANLIIDWRRHSDSLSQTQTYTVCVITNNTWSTPLSTQRRCVCVCVCVCVCYIKLCSNILSITVLPVVFSDYFLIIDGVSDDVLKLLVFIHDPKMFPLLLS